jgi:hypothetical protein
MAETAAERPEPGSKRNSNPITCDADLVFWTAGVMEFKPMTSSSRTAGTAVDRGYCRTSQATGGRSRAVLVGLVGTVNLVACLWLRGSPGCSR